MMSLDRLRTYASINEVPDLGPVASGFGLPNGTWQTLSYCVSPLIQFRQDNPLEIPWRFWIAGGAYDHEGTPDTEQQRQSPLLAELRWAYHEGAIAKGWGVLVA